MTSAYILIAAILLLGGLIAALGDRIGTKVGKARLRLFNLRPRQTAVVVTVMTGTMIAASTLGILFALSKSLRQGVFKLDDILKKLRKAREELAVVTGEKSRVEQELKTAKASFQEAENRLSEINQKLQHTQAQLKLTSKQANMLREEVKVILNERNQLLTQRDRLKEQITQLQVKTNELEKQLSLRDLELAKRDEKIALREEKITAQDKMLKEQEVKLEELQTEQSILQEKIAQRDHLISELDQTIATRDRELKYRESHLEKVESQLTFLQREVAILEQYYQNYQVLRRGNVALIKGQVLAFGAVRIVDTRAVNQAIDQLLTQANRAAIEATRTNKGNGNERVVQITEAEVKQLINQIHDGRDYVVRILSAGNYVQGEENVRVFADVALNKQIFNAGDVVATVSLDSENMTKAKIQERLDLLLAASQFRARRAGVLGEIKVGDGSFTTLIDFFEELNKSEQSLQELKAVVSEKTYTAGPLKLDLVAE